MIGRCGCLLLCILLNQRCVPARFCLLSYDTHHGFQTDSTVLRAVHLNPFNALLYTTDVSGEKQKIEAGRFWGYQDHRGNKYRIYGGDIYEVIQVKTMTIYRQSNYGGRFNDDYYFSVGPNESIYYLNLTQLKRAFNHDPCMLDLVKKMPVRNWFKTDANNTFLLLEAYGYCQQQTGREPLTTP
ncbi:MAG: hypothetical protein U0X91_01260 [Spirosomataceae bacterium]